jgi:hypothetical protein
MSEFRFTASMFHDCEILNCTREHEICLSDKETADRANSHLEAIEAAIRADERSKMLDGAPVVYGHDDMAGAWTRCTGPVTHTARLLDIQPIKGEKT